MNRRVLVGYASCGIAAGARDVYEELIRILEEKDIDIKVDKVGCVGMCHNEPIIEIEDDENKYTYGNLEKSDVESIVEDHIIHGIPLDDKLIQTTDKEYDYFSKQHKIVLRNSGVIDPEDIEEYIERDGYEALKKALDMEPDEIIDEVKDSG